MLNEPISSRAKILSQNVERMGVKNAIVVAEMPENLSKRFVEYFDKILVDAPCSGEGMFRKNADEALGEWSEENVALCAERQKRILDSAEKMLAVGGRLVYSTCTFSTEEDEGQVCDYLNAHPQMRLIKQEKLYPHKVKGEGHFVAVFEKTQGGRGNLKCAKAQIAPADEKAYRQFEKSFFKAPFAKSVHRAGDTLYAFPDGVFDFKGLPVLRAGVRLGEMKNGRFEPSHALAMCVKADECLRVHELADAEKYLRGETVQTELSDGWCLVCWKGYGLGLGKVVNGVVKNHLPKGLRKA